MAGELDDDLDLTPGDAGAAFKAEMAATNMLLGHWKTMVALLIIGLLSVLFYGQYTSYQLRTQRSVASEVSDVLADLPAPLQAMIMLGDDGGDPEALKEAVSKLMAIGDGASAASAAEAYARAAELAHVAKDTDAERKALEAIVSTGVPHFAESAQLGLAVLDQALGNNEAAIQTLDALYNAPAAGFTSQQAALELGTLYEAEGKSAEAKQVYDGFLAKWPDSPSSEEVRTRLQGLNG